MNMNIMKLGLFFTHVVVKSTPLHGNNRVKKVVPFHFRQLKLRADACTSNHSISSTATSRPETFCSHPSFKPRYQILASPER